MGVGANPVDEEDTSTGVCRHVGAAPGVMAIETGRGWLRISHYGWNATLLWWLPCQRDTQRRYHISITRASRNFEGTAWASYDMVFRRQAANLRSLDWGVIDSALYNEAFHRPGSAHSKMSFVLSRHPRHQGVQLCTGGEAITSPDCIHFGSGAEFCANLPIV